MLFDTSVYHENFGKIDCLQILWIVLDMHYKAHAGKIKDPAEQNTAKNGKLPTFTD